MNNLLKILLAIFLPPVCAFIQVGFSLHFCQVWCMRSGW
ncbi:conserved hypothetical protein [Aeromonas salmonicida subsp. salmonicida A449]|uniref:YqaE/Pmp3 family membrane protein n=2 Tax=Aeromonas salmonicida subsp. salmonicida TaxID=29491 RepID=A4SKB1_AERS4|nr:conserved hypothetical protein [Aeromonas salmonicida subsp. salmonicida A449]EHI51855.1 hypothetical protein IYQ_14353 [Aeromonas salmonicida subsp. salmonicida 01-B526]SPT66746.1 Uncharacterized homolog of Blt101 [Aeromonas salmonicida]SUU72340.1 Uncharacterized homolog of Blt101 [Aeromonas salmonicida]